MATMTWAQVPAVPVPAPDRGGVVRWAFFGLVVVGALFFYFTAAARYFNYEESTYGRYWPSAGLLITHVTGGSMALLAGLFQIWSGLRGVKLNFHRWIGKIYFSGVVIGSTSAFYLASVSPLPAFGISLAGLGIAWIGTSAMAYLAVRRGRIEAHREWVIRSYVVTYGFVNFRWIVELPFIAGLGPERLATAGWLCWTLPLLFTEIILQWRRTAGPRRQGA